jgi:hypothetical protein
MDPLAIEALTSEKYSRADDGTILPSGRGAGILSVELTRESESVRIPLLYYNGYTAEYKANDNSVVSLPIAREKDTQVAEIDTSSVEPGGTITVEYRETRLQRLSLYTSLLVVVLLLIYTLISLLKKRRALQTDLAEGK